MKKNNMKALIGTVGLALIAVACGKGLNGTYSVNSNYTGSCGVSSFNMNLDGNGNGSGSTSCYTANLSGNNDGNGHLNATYVITPTNTSSQQQYGGYYGGYYNPYYGSSSSSSQQSCTYTGTINFGNGTFTGVLTLSTNTSSSYYGYSNSSCQQTITINGTMTN